ncbi:gamma-butyrobetaine dioxygenase [Emiliania huxleyi CCMP1516]|uniref:TauD/TfdA-like domain-containing protein n=2 Tax=Emiliania huxleyi TaxID=2903 RepID=A0A0D3JPY9_EMIH1|nr:gamma-butyrobetaine dioxygenase [Emiliania huxleyi CCMP1516]EOD25574.1 gamma-butyrobetaine dioxygenase [Emiliania huxleyi CCMP1516]|eukprot:XP_005778003.1 gamma-butyrobetaine dioxygenase [Emiliania huxleyi CCMP1516]
MLHLLALHAATTPSLPPSTCKPADGPTVLIEDGHLTLAWSDGVSSTVHGAWLRERCLGPASVEQATKQPLHGHESFDDSAWAVEAASVEAANSSTAALLHVTFGDGHKSILESGKLKAELTGCGESVVQPPELAALPERLLWSGTSPGTASLPRTPLQGRLPPRHKYEALSTSPSGLHALTTQLLTLGFAIVEGVPKVEGQCEEFAGKISFLRALHAIKHCSCGDGEPIPCKQCSVVNYAVDAVAVAEQLRETHPADFALLANTQVRWENSAHDGRDFISAYVRHAPMIELEPTTGKILAINFSSKSGGYAPPMEPQLAHAFYQARRLFARMLNDPSNKIMLQLRAGDLWVFDNRRLLHGRSVIHPDTDGERHIEGCYMQRDGLLFHHERSRRASRADQ